jgi:CHAD domain-containing protein
MLPASLLPILAKAIDEELALAERAATEPTAANADDIHDLRVATRRLRAGLELWLASSPGKKLDRSRKTLRRLGRRLGSLRETDVNLLQLRELAPPNSAGSVAVEFALASETRRRRRRASSLDKELRRVDLPDLSRDIRSEIEDALDSSPGPIPLDAVARKELAERVPRLEALLGRALLHPSRKGLHLLRIELKKFRYSAELCSPAYDGRRFPQLLKRLKSVQDALGLVQDASALHLRIAKLRANLRRDQLSATERSLLPPMRAVGRLLRERTAAAVHELEACRREAFFSRFETALR